MPRIGNSPIQHQVFDSDCPSKTVRLVLSLMKISGSTVKRQTCDFGQLEEHITNTTNMWSNILLSIQTWADLTETSSFLSLTLGGQDTETPSMILCTPPTFNKLVLDTRQIMNIRHWLA